MLAYRSDEALRFDVHTQVDDLVAAALEGGNDQILANIVDITRNGADDHVLSLGGPISGGQAWSQERDRLLHGLCRQDQVGQEELPGREALAHLIHGGMENVADDALGFVARIERLLQQPFDLAMLAVQDGVMDFGGVEALFRHVHD